MIRASESLRAEADALKRVDGLVKRWAIDSSDVDCDALIEAVMRQIEPEPHEELAPVDQLMQRWGVDTPNLDASRFHAAIMARIDDRSSRGRRVFPILRIGAPLAAAAAVVLAITAHFWQPPAIEPIRLVQYMAPSSVGGSQGLSRVSFDRTPPAGARQGDGFAPGFAYGTIGVEAEQAWRDEDSPF